MSEFDRKAMIDEANKLSIEFKGNISNVNLAGLLAKAKGEPAPLIDDKPSPNPETKPELPNEDELEIPKETVMSAARAQHVRRRKIIANAKARAYKTHIVTITNKDNRENDVMTTAYLAFENQHFGLSKNVPLDIPIELEASLIQIASNCTMTLHKDEIKDGKRTGNKVTITVKKYAISYSRQQPK